MHNEYQDGLVQETVDRLLAIAGTFDDNGEMEVWTFNQKYSTPPVARAGGDGLRCRRCARRDVAALERIAVGGVEQRQRGLRAQVLGAGAAPAEFETLAPRRAGVQR